MQHDLTHASFFSGVGGLDLGLERAGWRTVSFSEIDPYASAVLAGRWPGVPNLGDITEVVERDPSICYFTAWSRAGSGYYAGPCGHALPCSKHNAITYGRWLRQSAESAGVGRAGRGSDTGGQRDALGRGEHPSRTDWRYTTLWTGGFPCQDLSVAGKRRGMGTDGDRTRSGLAYAFLDLVERHRPPAILLENVPGLLSSNGGKDLGALLGRLGELGYGWAYRILDAQYCGVPQRRRRVFICALHAGAGFGADSAAAVLSVGARCHGHSAAGNQAGEGTADEFGGSTNSAGVLRQSVNAKWAKGYSGPAGDEHHNLITEQPGRATRQRIPTPSRREHSAGWIGGDGPGLSSSPDPGGVREADGLARRLDDSPVAATLNSGGNNGGFRTEPGAHLVAGGVAGTADRPDDALLSALPRGLDSHRYRCCGNGVVSNVSEWIGHRLATAMTLEAAA